MKHKPAWYVAHVMTGTERESADRLNDAGMQALAPAQVLYERRKGKWWQIRRTIFPGYVFIRTGMSTRAYYYIKNLPGVIRLLGVEGPEAVPDDQMETVQFLANGGLDFGISTAERSDGKTTVTSGPLAGMNERIAKINARGRRATIEVPILSEVHQIDVGVIVTDVPKTQEDTNPEEGPR